MLFQWTTKVTKETRKDRFVKDVDNEGDNGDREGQVGGEDVEGQDNDGDRAGA